MLIFTKLRSEIKGRIIKDEASSGQGLSLVVVILEFNQTDCEHDKIFTKKGCRTCSTSEVHLSKKGSYSIVVDLLGTNAPILPQYSYVAANKSDMQPHNLVA